MIPLQQWRFRAIVEPLIQSGRDDDESFGTMRKIAAEESGNLRLFQAQFVTARQVRASKGKRRRLERQHSIC
ncbi:MAG: hypothetical protein ABSC22_18880 [Roseiarcus sp.]